ncbi:MAG TPA: magnesium transporter [Gemmataceae bacterium]|nr:magnesium transporter [Gemmataceae bacterium]
MSAVRHILADLVTRHMRTDPTRLRADQTVADALESVRRNPPSSRVIYFYVVDDDDRLKGVVPTRRLLLSDPAVRVSEIMVRQVIGIPHTATVLDACEFFTLHKLLAFPVVDENRRVVGLVDVDLYTEELRELDQESDDVIRQEAGNDLFQLIGVHLTEAEQRRPALAFRRRFPWLLANVAGGMLAALLADAYKDVATLAVVTPFIPVVLALSESVAIQSVSLALQTLHGERVTWGTLMRKVGRELVVGLLLGAACGLIVGLIALTWMGKWEVGLSLFVGIGGGMLAAAGVGLAMPLILKLLKRDPQVASGPIALATADMLTLLLYFNLGRWLLPRP